MNAAEFKLRFLPCRPKFYRVALRWMGDARDAEDIVQDAYLKLWNKREQLTDVLNAEAYGVALVKNLCYDALRRVRPEGCERPPEELNLSGDTNLSQDMEQKDAARQIQQLISQLPTQQRQVMMLRDVNDCSFEEIEEATGLNAVNIRVLLSRARKKIREQFNVIMNYENN